MQFCTAKVALGGDSGNVMTRDAFNPVSWPELDVLRLMHGDDSVTDIEVITDVPQRPRAERERLDFIYGVEPTGALWGAKNVPNELGDDRIQWKPGVPWFNPLTQQHELTGEVGLSWKIEPFQGVSNSPALVSQAAVAAAPAGDTETRPFEEDFGPQTQGVLSDNAKKAKGK